MDLILNEFELKHPPHTTYPVRDPKFSIPELRTAVESALIFYESQQEFERTAALCGRILARRKNSFKRMSGFKSFCKLNSALCRLLRININTILTNFLGLLPDFSMGSEFDTQLPSIASLDYILIRLLGLRKLFDRIFDCCQEVARYYVRLLCRNFFVEIISIILSIASSIWKFSYNLAERTNSLYNTLLKYRPHFPKPKQAWIPTNLEFPPRLEKLCQTNFLIDLNKTDGTISDENLAKTFHGKDGEEKNPHLMRELRHHPKTDIDLGEEISRDSLKSVFNINEINTVEKISRFFNEEEKRRQRSLGICLTKTIPNQEWIIMKKRVRNIINSNNNKDAVIAFKTAFNGKI